MFFRLLTLFVVATAALYGVWEFTGNLPLAPAILIKGAFAVPLATMVNNLILRGALAPFGHVAWTAIAAGAFWRVKGAQPQQPAGC